MIWAADTDMIKGAVGKQSGNIVGNDVVKRMLELHRQLWVEDLVPKASFSDDASRWGSDFRAGKIGIFRPKTAWRTCLLAARKPQLKSLRFWSGMASCKGDQVAAKFAGRVDVGAGHRGAELEAVASREIVLDLALAEAQSAFQHPDLMVDEDVGVGGEGTLRARW